MSSSTTGFVSFVNELAVAMDSESVGAVELLIGTATDQCAELFS